MPMTAASFEALLDPRGPAPGPLTNMLQDALPHIRDRSAQADLLFLERWEIDPQSGGGQVLRVQQIRRANPALGETIRAEITAIRAGRPQPG